MTRTYVQSHIWTNSEDVVLQAAITKYGLHCWYKVSSMLQNKTAAECKARWYEYLSPSIKKSEWSVEEEQILLQLAKALPNQWQSIAAQLNRTAYQCIEKFKLMSDIALNKPITQSTQQIEKSIEVNRRPEHKPARPDAQDLDEGELEMLQTAQARIANTSGKKDKRRLRERQMQDAKNAAKLARFRQLEAAGVKMKPIKTQGNDGNGVNGILPDFGNELFDTSIERELEKQQRTNETFIGKRVVDIEGLSKRQQGMINKQKKLDKEEKLKETDVASYVMKQTLLNDSIILQERGELILPTAQQETNGSMLRNLLTTQNQQTNSNLIQNQNDTIANKVKRKFAELPTITHSTTTTTSPSTYKDELLQPTTTNMNDIDYDTDDITSKRRFRSDYEALLSEVQDGPKMNQIQPKTNLFSKLAKPTNPTPTSLPSTTLPILLPSSTTSQPLLPNEQPKQIVDLNNIDATLKTKILQHQQLLQNQQKFTSRGSIASSQAVALLGTSPPFPKVIDSTFQLSWPFPSQQSLLPSLSTSTTNTTIQHDNPVSLLTPIEQNEIKSLINDSFLQLLQSTAANIPNPTNLTPSDNQLVYSLIHEELKHNPIPIDDINTNISKTASFPEHISFNPLTKSFVFTPIQSQSNTMNNNENNNNNNNHNDLIILRQEALLLQIWLKQHIFNQTITDPIITQNQRSSRIIQLRNQLQLEWKGYMNKNKQYITEFQTQHNKLRSLLHDYQYYSQLLQDENKAIDMQATYWSDLYQAIHTQHYQLQAIIFANRTK